MFSLKHRGQRVHPCRDPLKPIDPPSDMVPEPEKGSGKPEKRIPLGITEDISGPVVLAVALAQRGLAPGNAERGREGPG